MHRDDGLLALRREPDGAAVLWDPHEHRAIDHKYATTSYRSQGRTVDAVFVLASSADARRGLYVDVTRAREDMTIAYGKDGVRDFGDLLVHTQRNNGKSLVRDVTNDQRAIEGYHMRLYTAVRYSVMPLIAAIMLQLLAIAPVQSDEIVKMSQLRDCRAGAYLDGVAACVQLHHERHVASQPILVTFGLINDSGKALTIGNGPFDSFRLVLKDQRGNPVAPRTDVHYESSHGQVDGLQQVQPGSAELITVDLHMFYKIRPGIYTLTAVRPLDPSVPYKDGRPTRPDPTLVSASESVRIR